MCDLSFGATHPHSKRQTQVTHPPERRTKIKSEELFGLFDHKKGRHTCDPCERRRLAFILQGRARHRPSWDTQDGERWRRG
jgi:hypothetical protein